MRLRGSAGGCHYIYFVSSEKWSLMKSIGHGNWEVLLMGWNGAFVIQAPRRSHHEAHMVCVIKIYHQALAAVSVPFLYGITLLLLCLQLCTCAAPGTSSGHWWSNSGRKGWSWRTMSSSSLIFLLRVWTGALPSGPGSEETRRTMRLATLSGWDKMLFHC